MSTRAVIVALVVALLLGGAAWYVTTAGTRAVPRGVVQEGARVLEFDPATLRTVRVSRPSEPAELVRRVEGTPDWELVIGPDTPGAPVWALDQSRVTNLIRFLGSLRARSEPGADAGIGPDPTVVMLEHSGGAWEKLEISGRTLGGTGLVSITLSGDVGGAAPRRAITEDTLHRVFKDPGPKGWRQVAVFPGIGPEVSRIHLENQDRSMTLARIDGKWRLREPVGAPVDPGEMLKLISMLSELRISNFHDDDVPEASTTSIDKPLARIIVETDKRVIGADESADKTGTAGKSGAEASGVTVNTVSHELIIGTPSDAQAQNRYAAIGKGGHIVSIAASGLTQALFDPAKYVSRRATDSLPEDIGGIIIEPLERSAGAGAPAPAPTPPAPTGHHFTRLLDHWVQENPAGEQAVLPSDGVKAVNDLLKFISTTEAASVSLGAPPAYTQVGRMALLSLGGGPISGDLEVGAAEGNSLVIHTVDRPGGAGVYRGYPGVQTPSLLAALAATGKAAVDAKTPAKPPASPPNDEVFK